MDPLFEGPGELRALCARLDWSATPLGPSTAWPAALRTAVRLMLAAPVATSLWVGPGYTLIYNDAYRRILGVKHPRALGRSGAAVWDELWPELEEQFEGVRGGGPAVYADEARLTMQRLEGGREEDAWFTYSLSALTDESGAPLAVYNVAVEITEAVRARSAVARERARLFEAFRRVPSFVSVVTGPDHLFEYANDAYHQLVGRDDIVGKPVWDALPDVRGQGFEELLDSVRETGVPVSGKATPVMIARGPARKPERRYIDFAYQPLTDERGASWGILVYGSDVTAHVRAAEALRENEARLRAIYDGTYEYIGLLSLDGTLLEANRASLEFIERTREDVIGRPFWETPWFAHTPGAPEAMRDAIARCAKGEFVRFEASLLRHSGSSRWFDISLHPVRDETGRVAFIVPEGRDIEDRRRAEAALRESESRYRSLFESIDEGFCVAEMIHDDKGAIVDYRFLEANPAFVQQTGFRDPIGRTIRDFVPDHDSHWFETYGTVMRTGEPIRFEARSDPLDRWYDVYAFRIGGADNHRVAMVFKDVSEARAAIIERERLLGESERARAEAESANRAKSDFLAIMSHELRTPLNAIGGYADLMEMGIRGPVTPQQREDLRRIQTSQRHLLGLINEVLNYAKLETGTVHYQLADVPMREALTAAESLVAPQARAKGLSLAVGECPPTLVVRADPEKLRQILVNLLSNAVKFTDSGGRIDVTCSATEKNVAACVRDSGIGIPADRLESIFEPFVQVRSDLTRPHEGTGLGLAISRDLARGMDGDIAVESSVGEGSTFALTLPRV